MSINWNTFVINVLKTDSFMTATGGGNYDLDVDGFRLALKDIEDDVEGITFTDTHIHNTEVVLSGVTYARFVEIISPYTVTIEDGQYTVTAFGANHNLADVKNPNQVSLITQNSAGLISVNTGSGVLPADIEAIADAVWDELVDSHQTTGTAGKKLKDNLKKSQFFGLK